MKILTTHINKGETIKNTLSTIQLHDRTQNRLQIIVSAPGEIYCFKILVST